jgi:hypothetical protein
MKPKPTKKCLNKKNSISEIKPPTKKKLNNTDLGSSIKCGERGSNTRPSDLQSDALPTELSPHDEYIIGAKLLVQLNT